MAREILSQLFVVVFVVYETLVFGVPPARSCSNFPRPPGPPPGFRTPSFRSEKMDIYYTPGSPPSGMILLSVKVLGVDANLKMVDLENGEQMKPEYLKINPQHTVPAMDDDGFTLGESRAIMAYLAELTPRGQFMYPKDPWKRAKVDEMLYFDVGRLYPSFNAVYSFSPKVATDEEKRKLDESFEMFEEYLTRNEWAAFEEMSIADLSLLASVTLTECVGYDLSKYPKITNWLSKMKASIPDYYTVIPPNLERWKAIYDSTKN